MNGLIYVVDDDPLCRKLVGDMAEHLGFATELFAGGEAVVARLEAVLPDLLILDIQMGRFGGFEVMAWLRERPAMRFPVMAMTASVMPSEQGRLAAANFSACLSKPLSLRELGARMKELCVPPGSAS